MARLQDIVTELEGDQVDLERSVELYGEGRRLVQHCEDLLGVAEKALREAGNGSAAAPEGPPQSSFDEPEDDGQIPF